ncbi:hypothetical protein BDV12DRAFT_36326 [Aspergillus spectabilis]
MHQMFEAPNRSGDSHLLKPFWANERAPALILAKPTGLAVSLFCSLPTPLYTLFCLFLFSNSTSSTDIPGSINDSILPSCHSGLEMISVSLAWLFLLLLSTFHFPPSFFAAQSTRMNPSYPLHVSAGQGWIDLDLDLQSQGSKDKGSAEVEVTTLLCTVLLSTANAPCGLTHRPQCCQQRVWTQAIPPIATSGGEAPFCSTITLCQV